MTDWLLVIDSICVSADTINIATKQAIALCANPSGMFQYGGMVWDILTVSWL